MLEIKKTYEYNLFKKKEANRDLNKLHLTRLKESMEKNYLISPIIVNESYEVIDGQHRLEAVKDLGLPVYFIIVPGYGNKEIQIYNSNQNNWSDVDFLNHYVGLNYKYYCLTKEFCKIWNLKLGTGRLFLSGKYPRGLNQIHEWKAGEFTISVTNADQIASFYSEIRNLFDFAHTASFTKAFYNCVTNPKVEWSRLKENLENYPSLVKQSINSFEYLQRLQKCYNYRRSTKIRLTDEI